MKKFVQVLMFLCVVFLSLKPGFTEPCSKGLIRAMKEEGLSNKQIELICEKGKLYERIESGSGEQACIDGKALNQKGGPLGGIAVVMANSSHRAVSDGKGSFRLPFVTGNVKISALKPSNKYLLLTKDSAMSVLLTKDRYPNGISIKLVVYDLNLDWDIGQETIVDRSTGLMWQRRGHPEEVTWSQAKEYCENLNLAGFDDWRMPTLSEQQALCRSLSKPGVSPKKHPLFSWNSSTYWSSTPQAGFRDNMVGVNFYYNFSGRTQFDHRNDKIFDAIAVRNAAD